ncbi:hypothetical protein Ahy_A07g032756 [Arachis hypogaea]|uniref:Pentatricopeptide repeat-containing protein n=1 Tax=Arachis hypogaea TaxID=3818 RepID=A0A445C7P7_ARAHY|nr:hypothetical protein Ahy_A07g032756 [Arachis hypogaea]
MALSFNPLQKGFQYRFLMSYFYDYSLCYVDLNCALYHCLQKNSISSFGAQGQGKRENHSFRFRGKLRVTTNDDGQNFNFGSFDTMRDDEEEEDSNGDVKGSSDGDDEGLEFMSSSNSNDNHAYGESIGRIKIDEHEFRMITYRSVWNPRLEGYLKYILKRLKPLHWRDKHNAIVYYTLLDVLSKTKLCRDAKRILRLMMCRGIKCFPEAFGYVMVSYSRAGMLRHVV